VELDVAQVDEAPTAEDGDDQSDEDDERQP
jgi:hypothetical protein